MIYKNNKEWTGDDNWQAQLGKGFKLKKSVKFYLTPTYQGEKVVDDKRVVTYPESYALPPAYSGIMNGSAVEIRYVTKATVGREKGVPTVVNMPDAIVFRNGILEVKKDQIDLYYFLTTHPRCETNTAYFTEGKDKKLHSDDAKVTMALSTFSHFIFKERNEVLEQEIAYNKQEAIVKAKSYIVNDLTKEEAVSIYKALESDWDEDMPISRIKNFLLAKAEDDPKDFMDQLNSEVRTFKTKVNEAVAAEVIYFDKPKKAWFWAGPEGKGKILTVAKGQDATSTLVKHLRDVDSGELYEAIVSAVREKEEEAAGV